MSVFTKIIRTVKSVIYPNWATDRDSLGGGASLFLYGFIIPYSLDMLTRYFCFTGYCREVVTDWFGFIAFRNYHFAFSWQVPTTLMYMTYAFVLYVLARFMIRGWSTNGTAVNYAWLAISAGAAANIMDRLYFGYVRDFIRVWDSYFNLGDVWIVVGVIFICMHAVRETRMSSVTKV